jgi:hypothetical protein
VDFFERYLGIGVRGDGSMEVLFLVVLGIILVAMAHFFGGPPKGGTTKNKTGKTNEPDTNR